MNIVDFQSELWDIYRGAYGSIKDEVELLMEMGGDRVIPPRQKIKRLDLEPKDSYRIAFDNLCEGLWHQMSFYPATYLAMPYMVMLLDKQEIARDFQWQLLILSQMGICLSTDIPINHTENEISGEILESYLESVELLKCRAKDFLFTYLEELRLLDSNTRSEFCTGLLGLLGDRQLAYALSLGGWDMCYIQCGGCGYLDEDLELSDPEQRKKIIPAPSPVGGWDKCSYEDTYVWFGNVLHLLGEEEAGEMLAYYYGTYTCPVCGRKNPVLQSLELFLEYDGEEDHRQEPKTVQFKEQEKSVSLPDSYKVSVQYNPDWDILKDDVFVHIFEYRKKEYEEIFELWDAGEFRKALDVCTKRIRETPGDITLYILRAYNHKRLTHRVEIDRDLSAALELEPDHVLILRARCALGGTKKRCLRHAEDLTRLIELDPENADGYLVHRAYCFHFAENDTAAREDLKAIAEQNMKRAMATVDFQYLYQQLLGKL